MLSILKMFPSVPVVGEVIPLNAGEVERVLKYWSDDATVKMVGFPEGLRASYCGKKELRGLIERLTAQQLQFKVKVIKVHGNMVSTCTETIRSDLTSGMTLTTTETYIVEEEKIIRLTVTIQPRSLPALQSLLHAQQ